MRRIALTYILLSIIGIMAAWAQTPLRTMNGGTTLRDQYGNQIDPSTQPDNLDSTDVEVQSIPPKLYMWQVSNLLGDRKLMPADTASLNFQNTNLVEGMTGHYNYLGNLGSPRLSRLFFERRNDEPTMFLEPFSSFYFRPEEARFTNSNVPYTNLTYYKNGLNLTFQSMPTNGWLSVLTWTTFMDEVITSTSLRHISMADCLPAILATNTKCMPFTTIFT